MITLAAIVYVGIVVHSTYQEMKREDLDALNQEYAQLCQ